MATERQAPPAHTIRVTLSGHCEQSPWANVFWVLNQNAQTPTPTELANFCQGIYGDWRDTVFENTSTLCHITRAAALYQEPNGDVLGNEFVGDDVGDAGGTPLPASVACVISWALQQRYRGGHPRTYVPGIPSGATQDNTTFNEVFRAPMQNSANTFHQRVNSYSGGAISSILLGTVSFRFRKQWRDNPTFRSYILGAATVDTRIDSQRRRLGKDRP